MVTTRIALLVLLTVFIASGSVCAQSWSSGSSSGLTSLSRQLSGDTYTWTLTNNSGIPTDTTPGYDLTVRTPVSAAGLGTSWYDAPYASDPPAPVPEHSGLLVLAVAASWLVTCMVRSGRRVVNHRNGVTVRTSERTSFGKRIELDLAGTRR